MDSPEGFPKIEAQLRFSIRSGMVVHLEDFYFRRIPLFAARADHGLPWLDRLVEVWGEELEKSSEQKAAEKQLLLNEVSSRESWRRAFDGPAPRPSSVAQHGASKVARV
jgi:glycerol-3-phosphate dehydrogenase